MSRRGLTLAALLLCAAPAAAAAYRIDSGESLFAVVTRKAGFAAGLAHDHLIAAADYEVRLEFDPQAPESTSFRLETRVEALRPDEPELRRRAEPRLIELGVLDEPFAEVSAGQRRKIRRAMLGDGQLDAAGHPMIRASVAGVEAVETVPGFGYRVPLELEVRGVRVTSPVAARYERDADGRLTVEAFGSFRFSDFGIKPYSAMLGAVRNRDEFWIYVRLCATAPTDRDP